jgi:hypothetical protein
VRTLEAVDLVVIPMEAARALIQMRNCEHIDTNKMRMSEKRIKTTGEATSSEVICRPLVRMSQITGYRRTGEGKGKVLKLGLYSCER